MQNLCLLMYSRGSYFNEVNDWAQYMISSFIDLYIFFKFFFFQVPNDHYLLLPTMVSQFKMTILSLFPQKLAQYWASRKYKKSLPKVVPQSPNLSSRLSHLSHSSSFRSTTNSTISSSMTSTSFWWTSGLTGSQLMDFRFDMKSADELPVISFRGHHHCNEKTSKIFVRFFGEKRLTNLLNIMIFLKMRTRYKYRAQSFTLLNTDICQYINGVFAFSRCLNGTFPLRELLR